MVVLSSASAAAAGALAETLAQAFRDDPAFCWLLDGSPESRQDALAAFFPEVLAASASGGFLRFTEDHAAVSVWRNPDAVQPRVIELMQALPTLLRAFGTRLPRALRLSAFLHAQHPDIDDFYYLQYVAVSPEHQGRGLGRQVITAGLSAADARPVVLETANPKNVPIYRRMGFEPLSEWRMTDGAPTFWTMLRAPSQ